MDVITPALAPGAKRASDARIWWLVGSILAAGVLLGTVPSQSWLTADRPIHLTWWMLAPAFAVTEIFVVHYQLRREQYTFTLSELPLAFGVFFATWPALVVARLVGGGLALRFHRRQSGRKLAFNLACNVLEVSVALALLPVTAGDHVDHTTRALLGGAAAVVVAAMVITGAIAMAISLHEGRPSSPDLVRLLGANAVVAAANASLAMVVVAMLWVSPGAGWLLVVVAAFLLFGYRSYARLRQKHDELEVIYDFTRRTGGALEVDPSLQGLLAQLRSALRAEAAVLVMGRPGRPRTMVRSSLGSDDRFEVVPVSEGPLWRRVESTGRPLLVAAPVRDRVLAEVLRTYGAKDALVAPLWRGDGAMLGFIVVTDRIGEHRTFTGDDLRLFEALANHASVSLENRHLVERLRAEAADKAHLALHDALTGLPNRLLFQERIGEAVAAGGGGRRKAAVMILDLDRFKEVNDTLGHHNGDVLLREVGDRLRRVMRAGDTVARLGGDEFAVLVPELAGEEAAVAAAEGIRHALEQPFTIADVDLDVNCSVGIAMWPDHGDDATVLLQRADVAVYAAKQGRRGVDVYDPGKDTYSLDRLALVGELRSAIEGGGLVVHYQPKADTATGRVLGMEALIRWPHPRRGDVPPEEIIAIAEQTGLIRPLTLWVLEQALHQCRQWHRDGRPFDVAVNLSIHNILDAGLPGDVLRLLTDVGLPASSLTFEITETAIMSDPVRTIAVLGRLRSMGVRLAIDDFGTGYSSFSHLRRLPVDEIKIDKSFVQHLATDQSDLVIVRSIVDLGRNLGLRVVAEGVEDHAAWRQLAALGCDVVQGYILSRPLAALALERWLAQRGDQPAPVTADVVPLRNPAFGRS